MTCAVAGCKNCSGLLTKHSDGITFHTFPTDVEIRKAWIRLINKPYWTPTKYSKVCSVHFEQTDFYKTKKGYRKLRQGVLPKLFLGCQGAGAAPSRSTSTRRAREQPSAVEVEAPQSETGDDLSLYLTFPNKSTESITASARKNLPEKRSYLWHDGFKCNICGLDIVGYRYTCVQCPHLDLCSACEARGEHYLHYVLRIPKPAPFAEIQSMLNAIRCQLLYGESKQPEPDFEPDPEPEPEPQEEACIETLKVEIKEEPDPLHDDAFQADHLYPEKYTESPMPVESTQPIQTSQPAYDTAMTAEMLQGNTLVIIENPVSASSAAAHTAAAADGTKRKLAHRSTAPHVSEKRVRLTPQSSTNQFIEVPLTGTVPVTTVPQSPAAVLVATVPQASTTVHKSTAPHVSEKRVRTYGPAQSAANRLMDVPTTGTVPVTTVPQSPAAVLVAAVPQATGTSAPGGREIKEEFTFQVFSHSKLEPKKYRGKPEQSAGKASTSQSFLPRLV